jgi:redox-sensitive bicupin YhaK (pirin superfamily)
VQLWINMPKGGKQGEPGYRHVKAAEIPAFQSGGARVRVIAGEIGGRLGPVATAGAPTAVQVSFGTAGGRIVLAPERAEELAAYVLTGAAAVGPAGTRLDAGTLAALGPGEAVRLSASGPAELLLVGGDPLDAPILRYGPFVMNSPDELERAIADYQAGRMGRIAA